MKWRMGGWEFRAMLFLITPLLLAFSFMATCHGSDTETEPLQTEVTLPEASVEGAPWRAMEVPIAVAESYTYLDTHDSFGIAAGDRGVNVVLKALDTAQRYRDENRYMTIKLAGVYVKHWQIVSALNAKHRDALVAYKRGEIERIPFMVVVGSDERFSPGVISFSNPAYNPAHDISVHLHWDGAGNMDPDAMVKLLRQGKVMRSWVWVMTGPRHDDKDRTQEKNP